MVRLRRRRRRCALGRVAGARDGDALLATGRVRDGHADGAELARARGRRRLVAYDVLRAQVFCDLVGYLWKLRERVRIEGAPARLLRHPVEEVNGLVALRLRDEAALLFQFLDEADDENLNVLLFERLEELLLLVEAGAVFAVGDEYERAPPLVLDGVALAALGGVLGGEVYGVNDCGLSALDEHVVERVVERLLVRRPVLQNLYVLAVNEADDEGLVTGLVAFENGLGGLDDLIDLVAQRACV